jgi:hypothetical protein
MNINTEEVGLFVDFLILFMDDVLMNGIETKQYANSVFGSCQKAHAITSGGLPDTERIDRTLVSKIGIISVPKQRDLVCAELLNFSL